MQDTRPSIRLDTTPDGPCHAVVGRWSAAALAVPATWKAVTHTLQAAPAQPGTGWNLEAVEHLDHMGAQVLWNHWGRAWPERVVLSDDQRSMLERVAQFSITPPQVAPRSPLQRFEGLGRGVMEALGQAKDFIKLIGQLFLDLLQLARSPGSGPWRDVSGHLWQMGGAALPITALVGFLIGVVLAYLTALQLRQFGAESFIVNILGIAVIRELGPLLAAILVAGRSGSAITAQIGVMRVTEELDAMRVMGISHGYRLVMPRAIALAIAMPLISVWTSAAALAGGMMAADLALGITPSFFFQSMPAAVNVSNLTLAVCKSVVFGLMIALVGCHFGLRVEPNTQSLGRGTTAAVVASITVVILINAVFAIAFRSVGV
ncbi:MAG: ABC transporter permease [Burkholderiaceae bacterium]|nr:ABC transporter permease [Burkholderiaceae bacterium]MBP8151677.1 ABC transporter permease [Xylophilus sp.]MBP8229429.1 ABC transporter permease [Xylophilus sp.]